MKIKVSKEGHTCNRGNKRYDFLALVVKTQSEDEINTCQSQEIIQALTLGTY